MAGSKKYKNKRCAYCGRSNLPTEREHVLAREFVLESTPVTEWPSAPVCRPCNAGKAGLEHYVTAAAQFGGRHRDALANLKANGERRLAKSPAVARELNLCRSDAWVKANGVWLQAGGVNFHWDRLEVLCAFMAKGLAWHHWRATLGGPDFFVDVHRPLIGRIRAEYEGLLRRPANAHLIESVGGDTFRYAGAQGTDNPGITVWIMQLYGGLVSSRDADGYIGVMTGPRRVRERAEMTSRWLDGTRLHL